MQAEDAAKKRAVNQHVDYDTFKNVVWLIRLYYTPTSQHEL